MKRFDCFLADADVVLGLSDEEFHDIVIAIQAKISSLHDRRERYHFWLKFDAPADYVPDGTMWSECDEARLQRLEMLMADLMHDTPEMTDYQPAMSFADMLGETDDDPVPASDRDFVEMLGEDEDMPVTTSPAIAVEIMHHLQHLDEFGVSGVVILQMDVFDHAIHLLKVFRDEKAMYLEVLNKMVGATPCRTLLEKLHDKVEWILESLDDVLPYLEGAFCINFHPGSEEAAGKEET